MSDLKDLMRQRAQRKADLTLDQLRGMSARNETAELTAEEWLPLDSIVADDRIQVRVGGLNQAKVESYAEALKAGAEFPAVELFREGDILYLSDGFHRFAAHLLAKKEYILGVVRPGGFEEAYINAEAANLANGLELTMADKKNIFIRRMDRGAWDESDESLRSIAKAFGVNASTISRWRQEYARGVFSDEGVANATPAEEQGKAKIAGSRKKGGRKPAKKQPLNALQKRQRALKNLRAAADAFDGLELAEEAQWMRDFADRLAADWGLK